MKEEDARDLEELRREMAHLRQARDQAMSVVRAARESAHSAQYAFSQAEVAYYKALAGR